MQIELSDEFKSCQLLGLPGLLIQLLIAILSVLSLFIKRNYEHPKRKTKVFLLDMFKQCASMSTIHMVNIFVSIIMSDQQNTKNNEQPDQCSSYLMSFLLDTSLGILLTWVFLNFLQNRLTSREDEKCKQGNFVNNHKKIMWDAYIIQTLVWIGITLLVKTILFVIFYALFDQLVYLGQIILMPISFSNVLKLLTVIVIIPLFCNILTFFIFDQWLKQKCKKQKVDDPYYDQSESENEINVEEYKKFEDNLIQLIIRKQIQLLKNYYPFDNQKIPRIRENAELISKVNDLNLLKEIVELFQEKLNNQPNERNYLELIAQNLLIQYNQIKTSDQLPCFMQILLKKMKNLGILSPIMKKHFLNEEQDNCSINLIENEKKLIDSIFESCRKQISCHEKYGISFWSLDGEIIMCDKTSQKQLEIENGNFNFFDKIIPQSKNIFKMNFSKQNCDFKNLKEGQYNSQFSFVIYSQEKKEKFIQHLKTQKIKKLKDNFNSENKKNNTAIYHRYLKGINSLIQNVEIPLNIKFLKQKNKQQNNPFFFNEKFLDQNYVKSLKKYHQKTENGMQYIIQGVIIKTRIMKRIPKFELKKLQEENKMIKIQKEKKISFLKSDYSLKILLIGSSSVGKSCMLMRYTDNNFTNNFFNTIGVDFKMKNIELEGKQIQLKIWDTAGQERFRTITCNYYHGAHGILLVYDITDKQSFESIREWMTEVKKFAKPNVIIVLIGNKNDLEEKRSVSFDEGQKMADFYGMQFFETSAKESIGIDESFEFISKKIIVELNKEIKETEDELHISKITQRERIDGNCSCQQFLIQNKFFTLKFILKN